MKLQELHEIIESLAKERPIFHSEADFKFALAWKIKMDKNAKINLEVPSKSDPQKHIDIVVDLNNVRFPIELKYKTKELKYNDGKYNLKNHGAQNLGRYDLIKDVSRIEEFIKYKENKFKYGFALWLTNDSSYQQEPKNKNVDYAKFTTHDKIGGEMCWKKPKNKGKRKDPIKLDYEYKIEWKKFDDSGVFQYALIPINFSEF